MAINSQAKLIAHLQREMYVKAHLAVESHKVNNGTALLNEADPHPKVEKDINGKPLIPTREDYSKYFQLMAAEHIKDQVVRCEERWKALSSDSSSKTEREALTNELSAAKDALEHRPAGEEPNLQSVLNALSQTQTRNNL